MLETVVVMVIAKQLEIVVRRFVGRSPQETEFITQVVSANGQ